MYLSNGIWREMHGGQHASKISMLRIHVHTHPCPPIHEEESKRAVSGWIKCKNKLMVIFGVDPYLWQCGFDAVPVSSNLQPC
jgi:hypothetical protein